MVSCSQQEPRAATLPLWPYSALVGNSSSCFAFLKPCPLVYIWKLVALSQQPAQIQPSAERRELQPLSEPRQHDAPPWLARQLQSATAWHLCVDALRELGLHMHREMLRNLIVLAAALRYAAVGKLRCACAGRCSASSWSCSTRWTALTRP